MSPRPGLAAAVLVGLVGLLATAGCATEQERYCEAVSERQAELSEVVAEGGPTALLDALEIYRELEEEAPRDIRDEWQQVVGSLESLEQALDDAGVDPASYDPEAPPDDLTDEERAAIESAADRVGSLETREALAGLEQQARDVCKTPLTL
ncbi:hypothetical protein ACFP3Q_04970 [Nocardioides sp. GCM10027113]|uniref:hypothetical protein n=1 Tax=unclassified Nocardioides TaxID=2615069 RepID=UPI003605AC3F